MSTEIAISTPLEALPTAPAVPQAHSDDQLVAIWLHGRSVHTQRAYRADITRFRRGAGKPLPFPALQPSNQYRLTLAHGSSTLVVTL